MFDDLDREKARNIAIDFFRNWVNVVIRDLCLLKMGRTNNNVEKTLADSINYVKSAYFRGKK
jgi:hypothetical protein